MLAPDLDSARAGGPVPGGLMAMNTGPLASGGIDMDLPLATTGLRAAMSIGSGRPSIHFSEQVG